MNRNQTETRTRDSAQRGSGTVVNAQLFPNNLDMVERIDTGLCFPGSILLFNLYIRITLAIFKPSGI